MRHKKARSQIEPHRVPGGRQHTPSLEVFNANHCIFQEQFFLSFLLVHQGSFLMHGGFPPASITQSGLTTGKSVHGEPKSKARESMYTSSISTCSC